MSDRTDDQIRDMLGRAASDSPDPHPWADIERRADGDHTRFSSAARRTGVPLAAAACLIALIAGFMVVIDSDETNFRIDEEPIPTTTPVTIPVTTAGPSTTSTTIADDEPGWTGGLLDDLDTESLRPLASHADGDVIIPTEPSGWRVDDAGWVGDDPDASTWQVAVTEAPPDNGFGQLLYLTMSEDQACTPASECVPWGEPMTINGVGWQAIVPVEVTEGSEDFLPNMSLSAPVGDRWVSVAAAAAQLLDGPLLENTPIVEFLEGLRVGSPDDLAAIGEACWQCGVAGAEGDPFAAVESAPATSTTITDGAPTATSELPGPNDAGFDTGRPLTDLADGDVVVPTYIPPGLAPQSTARIHEHSGGMWEFWFDLETDDGEYSSSVRLWENGPIEPAVANDPNHPDVEIAGLTWEWNDFETARIAHIGPYSVWVYLPALDRSEAERFIEGLRAVSIDQYPSPIASDGDSGLSVIDPNDPASTTNAEIVASDDEFELAAVQVGDQVCTKLEQTTVPVTAGFAGNCWEPARFADSGVIDLYSLDSTDTEHLIIGVVDSPSATAARITSPDGVTVVVPTGPANQAIEGRFFLARLDLDASNGIRTDRFTIEDASP